MSDSKTTTEAPARKFVPETEDGFGAFFSKVFPTKIDKEVIMFGRVTCGICVAFLALMTIFGFSLHYLLLTGIGVCLAVAFEHFIFELSRKPEEKKESEEEEKKEKEPEKPKKD